MQALSWLGDGLFHVTIDIQAYQKNTTKLPILPCIFTSQGQLSNAKFSAISQGATNSFSSWGLHGKSVHIFDLIHHSVGDLSLQKTSGPQVTTGEIDYETYIVLPII